MNYKNTEVVIELMFECYKRGKMSVTDTMDYLSCCKLSAIKVMQTAYDLQRKTRFHVEIEHENQFINSTKTYISVQEED